LGYIYWIASYPNSGNTWIRSVLARLVLGEAGSLNQLWTVAPEESYGGFYQPFLKRPIAVATEAELAEARPRAQARVARSVEGFQFLKTHAMHVRHLGTPTVTPEVTAGAIYVVRNPLDVVVSCSAAANSTIDEAIGWLNSAGRLLPRNYKNTYVASGSWTENVTSWTRRPNDRLLVLRYEDLLADPLARFADTVKFLGMTIAPGALQAAVEASSFVRLQDEERKSGFVERPKATRQFFRRGEANQWRTALSDEQVAKIVRPNRTAMIAMDYWQPEFDQL
jgi:hypothetical protein